MWLLSTPTSTNGYFVIGLAKHRPVAMPSLHSAGIRVRLGTLPLAESITPHVVLKKGVVAARQCETAEDKLKESVFLAEEPVR